MSLPTPSSSLASAIVLIVTININRHLYSEIVTINIDNQQSADLSWAQQSKSTINNQQPAGCKKPIFRQSTINNQQSIAFSDVETINNPQSLLFLPPNGCIEQSTINNQHPHWKKCPPLQGAFILGYLHRKQLLLQDRHHPKKAISRTTYCCYSARRVLPLIAHTLALGHNDSTFHL